MIIFKCGECGHSYNVDTERVQNREFGEYCPNCSTQMPPDLIEIAYSISTLSQRLALKGWEVFALPEEASTLTTNVTFQLK